MYKLLLSLIFIFCTSCTEQAPESYQTLGVLVHQTLSENKLVYVHATETKHTKRARKQQRDICERLKKIKERLEKRKKRKRSRKGGK